MNRPIFGAAIWGRFVALFRKKKKNRAQSAVTDTWSAIRDVGVSF